MVSYIGFMHQKRAIISGKLHSKFSVLVGLQFQGGRSTLLAVYMIADEKIEYGLCIIMHFFHSLLRRGTPCGPFYANDFDGNMTFECPDGNAVTGIGSYHSTHHEDRRYKFRCTYMHNLTRSSCSWTKFTNLNARWVAITPIFDILTGVKSYHDNSTQ